MLQCNAHFILFWVRLKQDQTLHIARSRFFCFYGEWEKDRREKKKKTYSMLLKIAKKREIGNFVA